LVRPAYLLVWLLVGSISISITAVQAAPRFQSDLRDTRQLCGHLATRTVADLPFVVAEARATGEPLTSTASFYTGSGLGQINLGTEVATDHATLALVSINQRLFVATATQAVGTGNPQRIFFHAQVAHRNGTTPSPAVRQNIMGAARVELLDEPTDFAFADRTAATMAAYLLPTNVSPRGAIFGPLPFVLLSEHQLCLDIDLPPVLDPRLSTLCTNLGRPSGCPLTQPGNAGRHSTDRI
jgi:hypothetical protein